ncbi:MAG: HRDC domain-containing protein, partial [Campylobacterota bacterium]|nr:HRDC domain-containing protein [Campylobacterota bacterium]
EKFRALRAQLANNQGVPAYMIFGDKTLIEMSSKLPSTHEEFLDISGVGQMKLEKYGDQFLELCNSL